MSFFKILRPYNCFFVVICVFFGAFYKNSLFNYSVLYAVISAFLITGAGYIMNDFFDLTIDIINKPNRVLPSGKMNPKTAYIYSVSLFLTGIIISFLTKNVYCVFIAVFNSLALFYYAKFYKMRFLSGNLIVSYAAASTFIFGGLCNNNFKNSLFIAIFAFLYTLIREFIKDAEDIEGDSKSGAHTLAIHFGRKKTVLVSIIPSLVIVLFIFYLFHLKFLYPNTFIFMNLFVSLPLIIFIIYLINHSNDKGKFLKISSLMKVDMLILLIILWMGNYENIQ